MIRDGPLPLICHLFTGVEYNSGVSGWLRQSPRSEPCLGHLGANLAGGLCFSSLQHLEGNSSDVKETNVLESRGQMSTTNAINSDQNWLLNLFFTSKNDAAYLKMNRV